MTHLSDLLKLFTTTYRHKTLLRYMDRTPEEQWHEWSGEQLAEQTMLAAQALIRAGVQPGDRVALYSQNMMEGIITELGLMAIRAICVPLYATCSPEQVAYITEHAEIKLILVGEQFQYNNVYPLLETHPTLQQLVILDERVVRDPADERSEYFETFLSMGDAMPYETEVRAQLGAGTADETAVIIYTSGTTGTPKGVQITHHMILTQVERHQQLFPTLNDHDVSVNFLPLSHVFEKLWVYFCFATAIKVVVVTNPKRIMELMPQIRPTVMCNVPRYWEKVYQGVQEHIERSKPMMQRIYQKALRVGHKYHIEYRIHGRKAPWGLRISNAVYRYTVFYILKRVLGLERGRFFPTAGAPLSDEINEFLQSAGFNIVVGYGLSESSATVSCYLPGRYVIGSVGEVLPGIEVRIDPETQEIQLRGDTITPGYYHNDEANAAAFTDDGWFRTGDAGRIEGSTLFFTERIKELYKTSNGKYIAPQQVESLLSSSPLIEQCAVVADERKFVAALIYPNYEQLRRRLRERGQEALADLPTEDLAQRSEVCDLMLSHIEPLQAHLAGFEKVKRIALLAEPFSIEAGTLTPTLKLKRKAILEQYAELIEKLYL